MVRRAHLLLDFYRWTLPHVDEMTPFFSDPVYPSLVLPKHSSSFFQVLKGTVPVPAPPYPRQCYDSGLPNPSAIVRGDEKARFPALRVPPP